MNKGLLNSLTEAERNLVAETEREALLSLDEDELLALHDRVRRARTKHVKLYRRQASARVERSGGRGLAYGKNQRNRDKAEVFEVALARVSRRVDKVAREAAADLRAERLAAARSGGKGPDKGAPPDETKPAPKRPRTTKTTGGVKKDASTRSMGARRQAKRDSR